MAETSISGVCKMKIQDVCNQTGLTKRNIHFYIRERLIFLAARLNNGYYDFSDDDCRRLDGYINPEHCHHGELEALAAFHILITDVIYSRS